MAWLGLVDSLFSLAIERSASGPAGYLALGGVPPIDFVQDFTSTPILVISITDTRRPAYVNGKAISVAGTPYYIVDSGTIADYFPTAVANAINNAFKPAAVYREDVGGYVVSCAAVPPVFGIEIGVKIFYTNPLDRIIHPNKDANGNDICISSVIDGGDDTAGSLYVLGDTFLKNVVAVFDVRAGVMQFVAGENYTRIATT
ncbi:hypothetical protein OCU04_005087 [Sclerotinia nivalis]|uniref:Peptidase A1 domain-containing protein n=1 Tax=Sclerotinia nivalis TaxID=352851 RepID=A0A9X0ANF4_9HELO|nr:hypothetical protein OCU04_005087 [Sclerotinia nivalis]